MEYQVTIALCTVALALAVFTARNVARDAGRPGWAVRRWARRSSRAFSTETETRSAAETEPIVTPEADALIIKPLGRSAAQAYSRAWLEARALAVEHIGAAVTCCDRLLGEVMCDLGYPLGDLHRYADELSRNHAMVMHHYGEAHGLARRHADGLASSQELLRAMAHFEELFEHLLLRTRSDLRPA